MTVCMVAVGEVLEQIKQVFIIEREMGGKTTCYLRLVAQS